MPARQTAANAKDITLDLDMLSSLMGGYCYNNQLMMAKITQINYNEDFMQQNKKSPAHVKLDVLCCVLVMEGELTINLDYNTYTVASNSILFISPFNTVSGVSLSPDCRYYVLMAKQSFIEDSFTDRMPQLPMQDNIDMSFIPSIVIQDKEMPAIKRSFDTIFHYLKEKRGELTQYFLYHACNILQMELFCMLNNRLAARQEESEQRPSSMSKRKEEITMRFMLLLREYSHIEHKPNFYANKLCISVQYLSLILQETTGNTASQLIAKSVIVRAKRMLRTQGSSIAQTAEQLNFADQSSFGKFFKKHTGISPKKYMEQA